jgi:23S rRNA pseudoU1915 N3-methylase RlmH
MTQSQKQSVVVNVGGDVAKKARGKSKPRAKPRAKPTQQQQTQTQMIMGQQQPFAQVIYPTQVGDVSRHLNRMSVGASVGNLMTATPSQQPVGHEASQDAYKQQVALAKKEEELQKKLIKSQLDNALKKKIKDDKKRLLYEAELTAKSDKLSADILKEIEEEAKKDVGFKITGDEVQATDKALAHLKKLVSQRVESLVDKKPTAQKPHSSVGRLIEEKPTANPLAQPQMASSAEENPLLAVGTQSLMAMGEEVIPMTIKTGIVAGGGGAEEPIKLNPEQRQEMLQVGQELGLVGRKTPLFPEGFEAEEARGEAERAEQSRRFYEDNPAFF